VAVLSILLDRLQRTSLAKLFGIGYRLGKEDRETETAATATEKEDATSWR